MLNANLAKRVTTTVLGIAVAGLLVSVGPVVTTATPVAFAAASNYYLKLDGIDGESTSAGHPGTIEVDSWSFGASNASTIGSQSSGAGAGKVSFQDLHFTTKINKTSPQLFLDVASGAHIPHAVLYVTRKAKGGEEDYYKIELQNVMVTSIAQQGTPDDFPTDSISLNFQKVQVKYLTPKTTTWTTGGWDVLLNTDILNADTTL